MFSGFCRPKTLLKLSPHQFELKLGSVDCYFSAACVCLCVNFCRFQLLLDAIFLQSIYRKDHRFPILVLLSFPNLLNF